MAQHTTIYNLTKPDPTDLFSKFLEWYNANLDIIDANLGGGGTLVEANPVDPATEVLNTIKIGATVYSIPSGGGGNRGLDRYTVGSATTPTVREVITITNV